MIRADDTAHVGKRFGRWLVMEVDIPLRRDRAWRCVCTCGQESLVGRGNILAGKSRGCIGCRRLRGNKNPSWRGHGDVPQQLWYIIQKCALARGIEVELTIQDLDELWKRQGGKCALTGLPLVLATKQRGCTASVDRIDSGLGYVAGNVQWVHKDVNLMKNRFNEARFIEICGLVFRRKVAA